MPAPYRADEVATSLLEILRVENVPIHRLEVSPDDVQRRWIIRFAGPDGVIRRRMVPYATAKGIYTPSEIARALTHGSWPFV